VKAISLFTFLLFLFSTFEVSASLNNNDLLFKKIANKYGISAVIRVHQWQRLIQTSRFLTEHQKLIRVNNFFNQRIQFVDDIYLWGKKDYWATPLELLVRGAGDCEDYSIAKYFTLLKMGVPERKIRITYVKALTLHQAHMIVVYSPSPRAIPYILDNLIPEIKLASLRRDLLPIYSFNDSGLWLGKFVGTGKRVGDSTVISMWVGLKQRMNQFSVS
jgi:predicted transglutaminase-like cysteine proteinase